MAVGFPEILIATGNEGKVREITSALGSLPITIRTLKDFPLVHPVEEAGGSYEENATAKALGYAAKSKLYALADDSGLEVDALEGRPGVLSARFGGSEISNVERNDVLLSSLLDTRLSRRARFVSVAVLAEPSQDDSKAGSVLTITKGICEGTIAWTSRGTHGFGYDSIFIPTGYQKTFGELSDAIKNRISHRAQALLQMRDFLKGLTA